MSLPVHPSWDMRMNSGTMPSCVGTAVVAMTNTSRALRPRKRSFENENPASVEKSTTDSAVIVPTMIELPSAFQNWISPFSTLPTLVKNSPCGISDGIGFCAMYAEFDDASRNA